jgi:hypothetical protein
MSVVAMVGAVADAPACNNTAQHSTAQHSTARRKRAVSHIPAQLPLFLKCKHSMPGCRLLLQVPLQTES